MDASPAPLAMQAAEDEWQKALAALASPTQVAISLLQRRGVPQNEILILTDITECTIRRTANALERSLGGSVISLAIAAGWRAGRTLCPPCRSIRFPPQFDET